MTEGALTPLNALKWIGIAGISVGINHIIHNYLNKKSKI
jgi:hypothetical protein